jgi:lysophospholipase L1-like esterase
MILKNSAGVTQFDGDRIRSISSAQLASLASTVAATAADRVQTTADRVQTTADRVQTGLDVATSISARDAALLSSGLWPTTAAGIGNGVAGTSGLVAGSGGTDGTFALAFSGGTQVLAPVGYFVVTGGAVTQVVITYKGYYSAGTPTISFAASSGLTGASVTAVMAANTPVNQYFTVPASTDSLILYKVTAGPVAIEHTRYATSTAVNNLKTVAGKYNGWPDPFFRRFDLTTKTVHGRDRWWTSVGGSVFNGWTRVAGTKFDGNALRRTADQGSTPFNGPAIWLDEIGATTGDTVTVYGLFTGSGAVARMPARFDTGADSSYVDSQINPESITGTSTVTTTSTPQWLRITATVPATAQRLTIYPYTTTAAQTFDFIACWAVKGAAVDCPDWPTLNEEAYYRLRDADLSAAIAVNAAQKAELDYMLVSVGVVSASATSTNLAVTAVTTNNTYGDPFSGWGERYTPAGISFNAIKIKTVGRNASLVTTATKWRTLNVVIRTGTNSHNSSSTIVAIGSITVNPDVDSLADVTIVLKDPTTGAVKTLTDADFSGGEYFIGVYARSAAGTVAGISPHRATQSNTIGTSYYITSGAPTTAGWTSWSSNNRVGVDHLLLTSPVESISYTPTSTFVAQVASTQSVTAPTVVLPAKMHLLQDREVSLYFDNLLCDDADNYYFDISGATTGSHQSERYTTNPSMAVPSHIVTLNVYDKKQALLLNTQSLTVVGVASSANTGTTKNVLMIGDSLTQAGMITQTLIDIAATDVMGVNLIGTRGTGANKHEGRGGWTINDYATVGRTFYLFTVSGVTVSPQINSTDYTNNGSTFRVQEISLSAGAGTLLCERTAGSNAPLASGTLTKSNAGLGDATIAFSASATASGNPFWIAGTLNFPQYLINNSLTTPNYVFIMLGTNDIFGQTTDAAAIVVADTALTTLDALITSIKAVNGSIRVVLIPPPCVSYSQDAFATSYGVGQTRWRAKRNMLLFTKQMISKYANQEASRIYLSAASANLDTVNNMQTAASAPVNSRSSVNVTRQSDGVHPALSGYQQIGDAVFAFLKNN